MMLCPINNGEFDRLLFIMFYRWEINVFIKNLPKYVQLTLLNFKFMKQIKELKYYLMIKKDKNNNN